MSVVKRTITIVVCSVCLLLAVWYFMQTIYNKPLPKLAKATLLQPRKQLQEFQLIDANGQKFDLSSLRGHWTLMFFGYTTCPDICPETLGIIRDTWSLYTPPSKPPVKFVFASITPLTHDTSLKDFLSNYNPDFIGIGSTDSAITQLSDQLGIYSHKEGSKINHTASLILIDPNGRLAAVLTPPFNPATLVQDLNLITKVK